jgi:hypothetical protein
VSRVVPKIELAQITVQVLFSYMVIYTVYTAFENRKVALNRICADKNIALFASVNLPAMPNDAVPVSLSESTVAGMIVGHYVRVSPYIFADDSFESLARDHLFIEMEGTDIATALD